MLVRRKNVAELKKHAPFQNRGVNNIVAVCASAEKNVKTFARAEKKRCRVKETCTFSK